MTTPEDLDALAERLNPGQIIAPIPLDRALVNALVPEDLEAIAAELDDGAAAEVLAEWTIGDLANATWAARHLEIRRRRLKEISAYADDQRAKLDAWETSLIAGAASDARFFEGRLQAFHARVLETDPRAKTYKMPDGTELRSQAGKLAVEVTDLQAFTDWAEMNGTVGVLRMADPAPEKAEIVKQFGTKAAGEDQPGEYPAITPEGEIVPGVTITRRPRSFNVSTETSK